MEYRDLNKIVITKKPTLQPLIRQGDGMTGKCRQTKCVSYVCVAIVSSYMGKISRFNIIPCIILIKELFELPLRNLLPK